MFIFIFIYFTCFSLDNVINNLEREKINFSWKIIISRDKKVYRFPLKKLKFVTVFNCHVKISFRKMFWKKFLQFS
jgi:hypothetical protein